jgi:hypothetical protein
VLLCEFYLHHNNKNIFIYTYAVHFCCNRQELIYGERSSCVKQVMRGEIRKGTRERGFKN